MDNNKKQAKLIVIGVIVAWIVIIVILIISHFVKNINTDEKGDIIIKQSTNSASEASSNYYDPFKNSGIDTSSYLTDELYIIDNDDVISGDFLTTKGRFYLTTAIADYLEKNGYNDIEYVTVMSESLYSEMNYATFAVKLGETEEYLQITEDQITSYFNIKPTEYTKDTSYQRSVSVVQYFINKYVYKNADTESSSSSSASTIE